MNFYDILGLDAAATEAIILDKSAALLLEIPTVAATMNDFFHPDRHQQRNTWEKYRRAARQCPHYDSWMRTALDRGTANPKLQQALKLEILKIEPGPEQQMWWEMLQTMKGHERRKTRGRLRMQWDSVFCKVRVMPDSNLSFLVEADQIIENLEWAYSIEQLIESS